MLFDVAIIEYNVITNVGVFDTDTFYGPGGMKELFEGLFPTWTLIPIADCEKADDGNTEGSVWLGWHRNAEGKFYDPNWVPPTP